MNQIPLILDACCGSRMMWFARQDARALFIDKRCETHAIDIGTPGTIGRAPIVVAPDVLADFTSLPFADESFYLVVFDPPHMERKQARGLLTRKYGILTGDWRANVAPWIRRMLPRAEAEWNAGLQMVGNAVPDFGNSAANTRTAAVRPQVDEVDALVRLYEGRLRGDESMNKHDIRHPHIGKGAAWFVWYVLATLLALALLVGSCAHAQAAPTLTFTPEFTRGLESVVPKFTWSTTPAAASCAASGATDWTGTKPASGTATLAAITASKTYTLACSWPGDDKAVLTWTAPTTYTNGSPLTIAKYQVRFGTNQADVDAGTGSAQTRDHNFPTSTTATVTGITTPGTYFFCVRVLDAAGMPSDCGKSAAGVMPSKVITGSANQSRSIALTVDPKPNTAQNVEAQ